MADTKQFLGLRCAAILRPRSAKVAVVIRRKPADWSVSICIDLHSNWQRFHFLSQRSARVWLSSAAERFSQREQSSRDDHVTFQKNLFNEVAGGPLHVPGATWYGDTFRPQVEQLTKNFIDLKGGPRDLFMFRNVKLSCHRVSSSWRSRRRRNVFTVDSDFCSSWLEASLKWEPKSSKSEKLNFVEDDVFIWNRTRCRHFQLFNNTEMQRRLLSVRRNNSRFLEISWRPHLELLHSAGGRHYTGYSNWPPINPKRSDLQIYKFYSYKLQ